MSAALEEALREIPVLDAHTHLVGGQLGARGLHDVLLYHMSISELYAAGCPDAERLTQYPGWPDIEEAHARLERAVPFLPHVANTGIAWGARIALADLYDWHAPITPRNWRRLDDCIRERANDRAWHREILKRAGIRRLSTEWARREQGQDDEILHYALEWAFFTRAQWGEFDTALYEVERCWGRLPESPSPIGGVRPAPERSVRTLDDVHEAVQWYVEHLPADRILATATHLSTDIDYRNVSDDEMTRALARRADAGPAERDIYASYVNEAFLSAFGKRCADRVVFQFSLAAEPLPEGTASRVTQKMLMQLAGMIARHPRVRFQCFLASAHANQTLCTFVRGLPNFSLVGYWWHNFFPEIIERVMNERLDMLPANRQIGFFSDAYCAEWSYAKMIMVRRILARVLAKKIELGQYDMPRALDTARQILYDAPRELLRMEASQALEPTLYV